MPVRPPSRAQLEVLAGYVESGLTVDDFAARHGTSPENIAQRLRQARKRLGASTSAQAYAIAIAEGLIRPGETRSDTGNVVLA